jgi:hypothetical protein
MMKMINIIAMALMLNGCTAMMAAKQFLPRDHDPALASAYVTTKIESGRLNCRDKSQWDLVIEKANWMNEYAQFRNDPQKESTASIVENLNKGKLTQSEKACEIWIDLVQQRLVVLNKAWSTR